MSEAERLNVGIVGVGGRGKSLKNSWEAIGATIQAVCDIDPEGLDSGAEATGACEKYIDYAEMIDKSDIDAVMIATPMHLHVSQSVAALEKGLHVLSEVPAAVNVDECRQLVAACKKSGAVYMMAENYSYQKPNVLVRELVRQGLFGDVYYAEGEYLHELKELNETTVWRREWQTGIAGITYGTHSLGPILQWMPGDRVVKVCCEDVSPRHTDPRGDNYAQTSPVMLCKTAQGRLIKIRVDMISDRPHAMTNYSLQGTDGAYESGRGGPVDRGKIWLRELSDKIEWQDADSLTTIKALADKYLPEIWRNPPEAALKAGHGGGDYFELLDFVNAIKGIADCPSGIHESMDMTLPGLISQESVLKDGAWIEVPDSRDW